jgi:hypothetical protein
MKASLPYPLLHRREDCKYIFKWIEERCHE